MRKVFALAALIFAICSIGALAGTASAASPAIVVNHGTQVGDNCSATVGSDIYVGFITHLVETSSGKFSLGCILSGPATGQTANYNGLLVTASGMAVLSENGVS